MENLKVRESLRAIKILKIESALTSFIIFMPVAYLLFAEIGLNQFQIGLTQAIFAGISVFLQIPTGYFADSVSRKISNASGDFIIASGTLVYFFAGGFWQIVFAEVLLGFGLSLTSGADAALMKAHCKIAKKDYRKQTATLMTIGFSMSGLGAIVGGLIGEHNIRIVFLIQAVIFLIAGGFALTIKNAGVNRTSEHKPWKDAWIVTKYCLHGHKELAWRIFLGAGLGVSTMLMVWFLTPMFLQAGISIKFHGVLFAAISVFSVVGSEWVKRGTKLNMLTPFLIAGTSYVVLGWSISMATILIFLLASLARGINSARVSPYIQEKAGEDIQATALSVYGMAQKLAILILLPIVNYLGNIELRFGLMASAVLCAVFYIFFKLKEDKLG